MRVKRLGVARCLPALSLILLLGAVVPRGARPLARAQPTVPPGNDPARTSAPARPDLGDAHDKAKLLFEAIVHDDPARAASFFFPREAFLLVKAMVDPGRYFDRLRRRFEQDIHDLHERTRGLDDATFEKLELGRRGGWIKAGEEGNRLPYWAARHAHLHYRVNGRPASLEVRVLITWDDHWYVIHLNEFR